MKTIKLTKMQGCGNDFVIIDYSEYEKTGLSMSELAKKVCDRNFGVGADGMIIPNLGVKNADIGWYFYNSDGTTAQMCGNGIRCFSKYVYDKKLVCKKLFSVDTLAGIIKPELLDDGTVEYIPLVHMFNNAQEHAVSYGKVPGATDVVKFVSAQVSGEKASGYVTTLAIRSDGSFYDMLDALKDSGNY